MRRSVFAVTLAFFLFTSPASGAIEPPYKEIDYCYRIENIQNYQAFSIIARVSGESDAQLKAGECFARWSADEIIAIQKDNVPENILRSGLQMPVSPVKVYDLSDPRKSIEDVFTIDALDGQRFSLRLVKRIVQNDDGVVQERAYATMEEGAADSLAPGYEYNYTPTSKSEQEIPVVAPGVPSAFRSLNDIILNLFTIICFVLGAITTLFLLWSMLMLKLKKDQRIRYRRIVLLSILTLAATVGLYLVGYFIITQRVCCVILGE